jgi:hypothetical protein
VSLIALSAKIRTISNMKNRFCWLTLGSLLSLRAIAQENQPTTLPQAASSQPATSQPTSAPSSTPASRAVDPWSGQEVKLAPETKGKDKSPRTAHMLAWFSFGGGLALTTIGASNFLATPLEESKIPAFTMIGLGGALSVFGPSLGHFYAGEKKYAAQQSFIALAIVGGTAVGAIAAYRIASPLEDDPVRITIALVPLTIAGGYELQYAVRMAEDAPEAVKRHLPKRISQLSLLPNGLSVRF